MGAVALTGIGARRTPSPSERASKNPTQKWITLPDGSVAVITLSMADKERFVAEINVGKSTQFSPVSVGFNLDAQPEQPHTFPVDQSRPRSKQDGYYRFAFRTERMTRISTAQREASRARYELEIQMLSPEGESQRYRSIVTFEMSAEPHPSGYWTAHPVGLVETSEFVVISRIGDIPRVPPREPADIPSQQPSRTGSMEI